MVHWGCAKCSIVYHMVSDSAPIKICKKCGGTLVYWNIDYEDPKVQHDHMWGSFNPSDIDPDYRPLDGEGNPQE